MKEAELKELLESIYLKKLNYLCRMLVNEFGAKFPELEVEIEEVLYEDDTFE